MNGDQNIPTCNEFNSMLGKPTINDFVALKGQRKIVCLTAYSAPMANVLDPHCDLLLVGDSPSFFTKKDLASSKAAT